MHFEPIVLHKCLDPENASVPEARSNPSGTGTLVLCQRAARVNLNKAATACVGERTVRLVLCLNQKRTLLMVVRDGRSSQFRASRQ